MTAKQMQKQNKIAGLRTMIKIKNELCQHYDIGGRNSHYRDNRKQQINKRYPVIYMMLLIKRYSNDVQLNLVAERHIARMWHRKSHATIRHAFRKMENCATIYPDVHAEINQLADYVFDKFGINVRAYVPELKCREHFARE